MTDRFTGKSEPLQSVTAAWTCFFPYSFR